MPGPAGTAGRLAEAMETLFPGSGTEWAPSLVDAARGVDLFAVEAYTYDRAVRYHLDYLTLRAHLDEFEAGRVVLTTCRERARRRSSTDGTVGGVTDWADRRKHAIEAHAAELRRRQAAESERAAAMLVEFAREARARGLPSVPLVARSHNGRHRYRTGLRGWYLRPDGGVAVDEDGRFYLLSVPTSLRALLTGARVEPSRPQLVLGEGGRDGERITLRAQLDSMLAGPSG